LNLRDVQVTALQTKKDFARYMKYLVENVFKMLKQYDALTDNLNTQMKLPSMKHLKKRNRKTIKGVYGKIGNSGSIITVHLKFSAFEYIEEK